MNGAAAKAARELAEAARVFTADPSRPIHVVRQPNGSDRLRLAQALRAFEEASATPAPATEAEQAKALKPTSAERAIARRAVELARAPWGGAWRSILEEPTREAWICRELCVGVVLAQQSREPEVLALQRMIRHALNLEAEAGQ